MYVPITKDLASDEAAGQNMYGSETNFDWCRCEAKRIGKGARVYIFAEEGVQKCRVERESLYVLASPEDPEDV